MKTPLDRRLFLKSTGLSLATAAVPALTAGASRAQAGELTGRLKKAAGLGMVQGNLSTEDKFRLLKDAGFDGVEVPTRSRGSALDTKAVARASDKVELPVHGVVNASHPDIKAAINEALVYNANSVLHVVSSNQSSSFREHYRQTQNTIRRAIPYAEKNEVYILIENVWASFLIEPLTMARYIDELDSPYVKAYFDIGNVVRWGCPHQWIEVLGKRIVKLHAKEYNLTAAMNEGMAKGFNFPLGKGSIDWAKVRKELLAIDYRGWVTAEVRGGDRDRLADIARQMDHVLDL